MFQEKLMRVRHFFTFQKFKSNVLRSTQFKMADAWLRFQFIATKFLYSRFTKGNHYFGSHAFRLAIQTPFK